MSLIENNFPSGNIIFDRVDNNAHEIHLNLNREFNLYSHWFFFQVNTVLLRNGGPIKFLVDNALKSPFAAGWNNYRPFYSSDGEIWHRIPPGNLKNSSFQFEIKDFSKSFFLSWYLPYSLQKYSEWTKTLLNHPVFTFVSENKQDYIIAGDCSKPAIVIVSRQHPGESMASFVIEGLFNSFNRSGDVMNKVLANYSIIIFPLLNKTGVERGFHRVNSLGQDLNRCWQRDDVEEITLVKNKLASFKQIHTIIDIHGDEVSELNYVYYHPNNNINQKVFLTTLSGLAYPLTALPEQSFIKRFIKHLVRKKKILRPGGVPLTEYGRRKYKANTYTIEVSAKATAKEECYLVGENIYTAILSQLCEKKP